MATRPKTKPTKQKEITDHTWTMMHAAFVAARTGKLYEDSPTLSDVARTFSVPLAEAKKRAFLEGWELERAANESREWLAGYGRGATTEAEFIERWGIGVYSHILAKGPVGERWVKAQARHAWIRAQANISKWEALIEEREARAALDELEERERCTCHRSAA